MAPTAQEVALGWAIELITVSSELKGDAKMKILNALTPKLKDSRFPRSCRCARAALSAKSPPWHPIPRVSFSPDGTFGRARYSSSRPHSMPRIIQRAHIPSPSHSPPSSLSFRFACSSTPSTCTRAASRRSTRTFRRRCSRRITVGDRVHDSDRDQLPLPLRSRRGRVRRDHPLVPPRRRVRPRARSRPPRRIRRRGHLPRLSVGERREFLNTRQSVGRLVASLRAGDDAGKRDILLSGYRAPALILADLGAYAKSVIEALGPAFEASRRTSRRARTRRSPRRSTGDPRASSSRTTRAKPHDSPPMGRNVPAWSNCARRVPGSGGAGPSSKGRRKRSPKGKGRRPRATSDETAAPIARSKAAKAKFARANAAVADPLAAALAASGRDASVARGTLDEPQTRAADVDVAQQTPRRRGGGGDGDGGGGGGGEGR